MAKSDKICIESATPSGWSKTLVVSQHRYRRHMGHSGWRDRRKHKPKKQKRFDSDKWREGKRGRESPMEKGERLRDKAKALLDSLMGGK